MDNLPEDCFSHIVSLTSPKDACRVSMISSVVRCLADSDTVWEKFLPSDYQQIVSRLESPLAYSFKKELFLWLCYPHLIDGGRKMFWLETSTSKKCYILSARELSITWGSNPLYWSWNSIPSSRFAEAVELRTTWWLQIDGQFSTNLLSQNTCYGAYLIVQFADRAYGLDTLQSEVSLQVGSFKAQGKVYLRRQDKNKSCLNHVNQTFILREGERQICEREDGWCEIDLGSFYTNSGCDEEVQMSLKEVVGQHLKGGLIVEGFELRPKY